MWTQTLLWCPSFAFGNLAWRNYGSNMVQEYTKIPVHLYALRVGPGVCNALALWYTLTGSDTTSQFHGKRKKSAWKTCKHINGITDTFTRYFLKIWLPSFFRKKYSLYILNETCLLYQEFKQVFILKISASLLRTGYLFFWLQAQNLWNFWNLVSFISTLSLWMCEKFLLINTNFSFALF